MIPRSAASVFVMAAEQRSAAMPDGQPNPGPIGSGLNVLGEDAFLNASNATPDLRGEQSQPSTLPDVPSYFSDIPGNHTSSVPPAVASPITPAQAVKDAKSGPELLRRLSLIESPIMLDADPREQYPSLRLTGRVISAAFCIPYKLYLHPGSDWVSPSPPRQITRNVSGNQQEDFADRTGP